MRGLRRSRGSGVDSGEPRSTKNIDTGLVGAPNPIHGRALDKPDHHRLLPIRGSGASQNSTSLT
ncbi:unnamed protein product, partial [Dovyalis caffra]